MKNLLQKLRKSDTNPPITIVSGLPRSGTSMMMKMLEAGGIPPLTDEIREADDDNPKGYYEFERVKKLDKGDTAWLADAQGKSVKVISALLKHLPSSYRYKIIFMRREMTEILASQRKMLVRRGKDPNSTDDQVISQHFERHLQDVLDWMEQQPNVDVLHVHYSETLADPRPGIREINEFLGSNLDTGKMAEVVDPELYRNRQEG